jgi:hypothetical protein
VKSLSVRGAVICIADVTKQVSPQGLQRCFQKARFSSNALNDETNGSSNQEFQKFLNQATYKNSGAEDCLSFDSEIEMELL